MSTNGAQQLESGAVADRALLLEEYKKTTDHYELARLEQRIWEGASAADRRTTTPQEYGKRGFLAALLGVSAFEVEVRGALWSLGSAADPLWSRIRDGSLSLGIARRVSADAKYIARQRNITVTQAMLVALTEYDNAPKYSGGKRRMRRTTVPPRASPSTAQPETMRFWTGLREQVATFMRSRMPEADEMLLTRMVSVLMTDLKTVTDIWVAKINRARATETSTALIRHGQIIDACRTLKLDPPRRNEPVDLKQANTQKRRLARAYHPDSGSRGTEAQYQQVLEAYEVLETYNQSVVERKPHV